MAERPDCPTCASTCCRGGEAWRVVVSAADLERLGPDASRVERREQLEPNHIGVLQQTADGACAFLHEDGCAVYERRPEVCRLFGAVTCDRYIADPAKVAGRVRLRVLPPGR